MSKQQQHEPHEARTFVHPNAVDIILRIAAPPSEASQHARGLRAPWDEHGTQPEFPDQHWPTTLQPPRVVGTISHRPQTMYAPTAFGVPARPTTTRYCRLCSQRPVNPKREMWHPPQFAHLCQACRDCLVETARYFSSEDQQRPYAAILRGLVRPMRFEE